MDVANDKIAEELHKHFSLKYDMSLEKLNIPPHNRFSERTSLDGNQENIQAVIDKMANETITIKRMFQKCVFCV